MISDGYHHQDHHHHCHRHHHHSGDLFDKLFFLLLGSFVNLNDAWKLLFLNYYMVVQYFCTITIRLETEVIIIVIYQ